MSGCTAQDPQPSVLVRLSMDPPKRLVILGANLTALAVLRRASRLGVEPYVVDVAHGPAFESRLAKRLVGRHNERSSLIPSIAALGNGNSWLISTADAWTFELVAHRKTLDGTFQKILHPSNDALSICLSKMRFAEWCSANAIPAPRQYSVDPITFRPLEDVMFPAMVRPALTQHAGAPAGIAKAREVNSLDDLHACLDVFRTAKLTPLISQSLLRLNLAQISVGIAIVRDKALSVVARKLRPCPQACRVGTLVETVDDPAAEKVAVTVMRKLGYEGIAEVEILKDLDTGSMYVIEINARPWLQFALGEASGRDLLGFIVAGGRLGVPAKQKPRRWLDFSGDVWTCFNKMDGMVRLGKLSFVQYLLSLIHADVYARWSPNDPWPFLRDGLTLARSGFASLFRALFRNVRSRILGRV